MSGAYSTSKGPRKGAHEGVPSRTSGFQPSLAGLRGTASLGVVLFHASDFILFPLGALTSTFYLGVPIFLMMSTYLLLNRLDTNNDLKHYFRRRITRIWPIYYGVLVYFYIQFPYPFWDFVRYLFFIEYYVNPYGFYPVSVFWTLQLEEAMYLIIPLIHRARSRQWMVGTSFVLAGLVYLPLVALTPTGRQQVQYIQMLLPVSLMAYGFGILARLGLIPSRAKWLSLAGVAGLFSLNVLKADSVPLGYYTNFFLVNILLYTAVLIGFASIVANPPKFLGWFTFLGEGSYALYAIHYDLVMRYHLYGIIYAVVLALVIESALRPREIKRRFLLAYPFLAGLKEKAAAPLFRPGDPPVAGKPDPQTAGTPIPPRTPKRTDFAFLVEPAGPGGIQGSAL